MPTPKSSIAKALSNLPTIDVIRRRISENLRERQLLRQMLRLAEQRKERGTR
jgi:hypothetical protein